MNSSTSRHVSIPTPGTRVVVRDAEWIVRRVDHAPGGYQIVCDGVSELVRGREAVFLTALEPTIQVLDPAETKLVPDDSAQFADSILYMESQLRQAVPNDSEIHVGHTAAMDCVDYQLDPARQALARPRQRILIADAVGLGKTLEAGVLVSELISRGRGRRILVLAVKSMLTQFQKEFWNRFTIPLTRLDSIGIQRVRSRIPTNHNPFYYYDKAIISIDTLKQDAEYRTYLEQTSWDIIVIDEAHNVADRGTASQRIANERKLFTEIHHHTAFSINIYGNEAAEPRFDHIANLYAPATVDAVFAHDGSGDIPGLKDEEGAWNTNGHRSRVLQVDEAALATFASLYDSEDTPPNESRLPALHSQELLLQTMTSGGPNLSCPT